MFLTSPIIERFIVIEGIDGAGTSTQRSLLCSAMAGQGFPVHETWEPTDGPIGKIIRRALKKEIDFGPGTLCRLFAADREEHCYGRGGIRDRCQQGEFVVSDRYSFSSFAYQAIASPLDWIAELNRGFPLPQYLFFIDVDIPTSSIRRSARGEAPELFEDDPIQSLVRANYHRVMETLAHECPGVSIHYIDGTLDKYEIHRQIWNILGFPPILKGQ